MVQPVTSSASTPVASVQAVGASPSPSARSAPAHQAPTAPAGGKASEDLSVSVEQAVNGVFVYTLRDTESGKLLVVIPHAELKTGDEVDERA